MRAFKINVNKENLCDSVASVKSLWMDWRQFNTWLANTFYGQWFTCTQLSTKYIGFNNIASSLFNPHKRARRASLRAVNPTQNGLKGITVVTHKLSAFVCVCIFLWFSYSSFYERTHRAMTHFCVDFYFTPFFPFIYLECDIAIAFTSNATTTFITYAHVRRWRPTATSFQRSRWYKSEILLPETLLNHSNWTIFTLFLVLIVKCVDHRFVRCAYLRSKLYT